jgi:hypothetical protein
MPISLPLSEGPDVPWWNGFRRKPELNSMKLIFFLEHAGKPG